MPRAIPYKGQVLNQLAAHFLKQTEDIIENWLQGVPDPNVSVGRKAEPVKIEVVVRGCLVGHAWREYEAGKRELCGVALADGLKEYDSFAKPIITPTTKAEAGHDEDISGADCVKQGLATAEEWRQLSDYALKLFARGQQLARDCGLVLADTKYEFGRLNGKLILIDEVHTPDSSRYFYAGSYDAYVGGRKDETPKHLSKEFVRAWLMENGFSGQAGQAVPELTDDFISSVSERYIELYDKLTGEAFVKADTADILTRIETNVKDYLQRSAS